MMTFNDLKKLILRGESFGGAQDKGPTLSAAQVGLKYAASRTQVSPQDPPQVTPQDVQRVVGRIVQMPSGQWKGMDCLRAGRQCVI